MPIATHKPLVASPVQQNIPKVESQNYKSVIVDDKQTPVKSLIAYIEGAPWTVTYFSQVVSKDNDIRDYDAGQSGVYQQYSKINQLELRVTTPLSSSQDTENSLVTVTGSALIYPFLVPNAGDVFISDAGTGRQGLFRIINVERKTFNRDSVFSIDFELIEYVENLTAEINDLNKKVIREYWFSKDRLLEGGVPTLQTDEHKKYNDLAFEYKKICGEYFRTFFNRETSTLILPGQNAIIYDSFLVNYVLKLVDTFDAMEIRNIKNLTNENDPFLNQMQFWKVMELRDEGLLGQCNKEMGLVTNTSFGVDPMMQGLRYSRIQYVVYPKDGDHSVFVQSPTVELKVQALNQVIEATTAGGSLGDILRNQHTEQNKAVPVIYPVFKNNSYVLSEAFYSNVGDQSLLETMTMDYITGKALNIDNLYKLVMEHRKWGRLEQFYYIPILLTLIQTLRKGLY